MPSYKYLLPVISVCPPPGYTLYQTLNLARIGALLDRASANVRVTRKMILGDREVVSSTELLRFDNRKCESEDARFEIEAPVQNGWLEGKGLPYLETHISIEDEAEFRSQFAPAFYTIYSGPSRKTFFSDNALKYGNTVTIYQIQAFGAWVEGYPTSEVDKSHDADESLILINPFVRPGVVDVSLEAVKKSRRFRIQPQSGVRISLFQEFDNVAPNWSGQVYVSGKSRMVMYVAKHSLSDPTQVTTIEHSNPYRGEPTHVPYTRVLRRRIGEAISSLT